MCKRTMQKMAAWPHLHQRTSLGVQNQVKNVVVLLWVSALLLIPSCTHWDCTALVLGAVCPVSYQSIYHTSTSIATHAIQSSLHWYVQCLRWWHLSSVLLPRGDEPRCLSCGRKTAWDRLTLQASDSRSPLLLVYQNIDCIEAVLPRMRASLL